MGPLSAYLGWALALLVVASRIGGGREAAPRPACNERRATGALFPASIFDALSALQTAAGRRAPSGGAWSACCTCLRVMAVGDQGSVDPGDFQPVVAASMQTIAAAFGPAAILGLGDLLYPSGLEDAADPLAGIFEKWYDPFVAKHPALQKPWYMTAGNHDYHTPGSVEREIGFTNHPSNEGGFWQYPSCYYSRLHTAENGVTVQFVMVDTQVWLGWEGWWRHPYAACNRARQAEWLEKVLGESIADWKVVASHIPLYSTGLHPGAVHTFPEEASSLIDIMHKYGVSLYLNGHNHNQEVLVKDGITYVTSGNGAKQYLDQAYVDRYSDAFKSYRFGSETYLSYQDVRGCARNKDAADTLPHVQMFSCSGGFMGLTFLSKHAAELVMFDADGESMPGWRFTIAAASPRPAAAERGLAPATPPRTCLGRALKFPGICSARDCAATDSCCTSVFWGARSCAAYCREFGLECRAVLHNPEGADDDLCLGAATACDTAPGPHAGLACTCGGA